jgi:L-iditol 2-dehydrogenase
VHYYSHGANGAFKIRAPMVLGHESCGVITALPADHPASSPLKVGDRVALEVGINCKQCKYCKAGRYNLCSGMRFASSAKTFPHLDGTLCETMTHPIDMLHKLPAELPLPLAALAEPLSVVLHAYRRARLEPGARVLVLGAGAVGLLACALAQASGATTVVAVDIEQGKLDFAKQMGWADAVHCLPRGPRVSGAEALEAAASAWEGLKSSSAVQDVLGLEDGFDAVFECTGVESCMQMAVMVSMRISLRSQHC